jgi:hypothetical protein
MSTVFGVYLILMLLVALALARIINSKDNELEWATLVASRVGVSGLDANWDKIGQGCGVILALWLPAVYAYTEKVDAVGLALVMGTSLLYLGGVSAYAATLRARKGTVEIVTEPAAAPDTPTKTTKTETPL